MPQKERSSRIQLVFFREFQFWFITRFSAYVTIYLLSLFAGVIIWYRLITSELLNLAGLFRKDFVTHIEENQWHSILILGGLLFALVVLSIAVATIFSRRIAGPLFAFNRHLEKCIQADELKPFSLRKGDLFGDLAHHFNEVIKRTDQPK